MMKDEATEFLTAYLECESRRSRIEGCNNNCNECELCYLQGTTKQHLEAIKMAIHALEKINISDADQCIVRSDAYNKAIDDFASLLKKMANESSTYYIRLADYDTNSDLRCYNIDELAEQLKRR